MGPGLAAGERDGGVDVGPGLERGDGPDRPGVGRDHALAPRHTTRDADRPGGGRVARARAGERPPAGTGADATTVAASPQCRARSAFDAGDAGGAPPVATARAARAGRRTR